ncbi:MAG: HD domain-containing protein [Bacteroidota bacterium]
MKQLNDELTFFRGLLGIEKAGEIESLILEPIAMVLETQPIQSLKYRYQLGLVYKVLDNDNAKHTRFDHTVGVIAKCIVAADIINGNTIDPKLKLSEIDVKELAVAAALHDCGHLPISHATERAFLTAKGLTDGITHEERILPLIIDRNPYFEDLRKLILSWTHFDENSFYRIASIISPKMGIEYEKKYKKFKMPKRAIQQLLVSDIDMDRLDYIIRDSMQLDYLPVTLIKDKLVKYVNGLSLELYKSLNQTSNSSNVELCLAEEMKDNVFYLLVSRVLLYKYLYFSEKVRSFEAVLTYLIGTFIEKKVAFEPLKLIAMSDEEFINEYLEYLVSYVDNTDGLQKHITEKYINVLRYDKVERFKKLDSIYDYNIVNPRLKEEFTKNINERSYIDNLRTHLFEKSKVADMKFEQGEILLDVFHLKTGGGELLVKDKKRNFKTLSDYMNGSNMHRLCSETRLDVYLKSDLSDKKKEFVKNELINFFKTM